MELGPTSKSTSQPKVEDNGQ